MTLLAMSADSRRLERGPERSDLEVAIAGHDAPDDAGDFVGECRGLPPTCAALYTARQRVLKEGREPLSYTDRDVLGAHYGRLCRLGARPTNSDEVVLRGRQT